jgi:hypothetical protein
VQDPPRGDAGSASAWLVPNVDVDVDQRPRNRSGLKSWIISIAWKLGKKADRHAERNRDLPSPLKALQQRIAELEAALAAKDAAIAAKDCRPS